MHSPDSDRPDMKIVYGMKDTAIREFERLLMAASSPAERDIVATHPPDIQHCLALYSQAVQEVINFGTRVLVWVSSRNNEPRTPGPISTLSQHLLSELDGVRILAAQGAVEPSIAATRAVFEASAQIRFMCMDDQIQRARAYEVSYLNRELTKMRRSDPESQAGRDFLNTLKNSRHTEPVTIPRSDNSARIQRLTDALNQPEFESLNEEYNRLLSKRPNSPPSWYAICSPFGSIFKLVAHLHWEPFYTILYSEWSSSAHASDTISGKIAVASEGRPSLVPIRFPRGIKNSVTWAILFTLEAFEALTTHAVPARRSEFVEWYKNFKPLNEHLNSYVLFDVTVS